MTNNKILEEDLQERVNSLIEFYSDIAQKMCNDISYYLDKIETSIYAKGTQAKITFTSKHFSVNTWDYLKHIKYNDSKLRLFDATFHHTDKYMLVTLVITLNK